MCFRCVLFLFFIGLHIFSGFILGGEKVRYEYEQSKMAVPVRLIIYADSKSEADDAAEAVYRRFDELNQEMSDWSPESELVRACRDSSETLAPVPISSDLYQVLNASRYYTQLTGGVFDPSVSPVVKLWRRSRSFGTRPPEDLLTRAKELIGLDQWELFPPTGDQPARFSVAQKNVRLDLGGIAKGMAIDEGYQILAQRGLTVSLVDAGGDLRCGDPPPGKEGWMISIASLEKETPLEYRSLQHCAVATSGDTFQFIEIDGVRYSHLIDPRSGEPITRRTVVTIFAPTAIEADPLASAVTILGPEEGKALIQRLENVTGVAVTQDGVFPLP